MIQVGNKEFANFVDANIPDVTRIVNQQDPVPILPGRFLGFRHPSGEIHIGENGEFLSCDGQSLSALSRSIQTNRHTPSFHRPRERRRRLHNRFHALHFPSRDRRPQWSVRQSQEDWLWPETTLNFEPTAFFSRTFLCSPYSHLLRTLLMDSEYRSHVTLPTGHFLDNTMHTPYGTPYVLVVGGVADLAEDVLGMWVTVSGCMSDCDQ